MPTVRNASGRNTSGFLSDAVIDLIKKAFQLSLISTVGLYGYLLFGLFSGQLAAAQNLTAAQAAHAQETVQSLSTWLTVSLAVTLVTSALLYYDLEALGFGLTLVAAFLAYGLQYAMSALLAQEATRITSGKAAQMLLHEIWITAVLIGITGIVLVLRNMVARVIEGRNEDLMQPTYGKNAQREEVHQPLLGAFAKCWQLPFCREGIRKHCPIYHARTKCWKERIGCMCEENVIRLAMGDEKQTVASVSSASGGFVPIGDLLKQVEVKRPALPTRPGPRGVRIPTNPHLTEAQKRLRCNNCIIYNEHQRQKYSLLSPLFTLAVPLLVWWQFDALRELLNKVLNATDSLMGHLSFSAQSGGSDLARNVTSSLPVTTIIIICCTLIAMTWALRFLEYCMFKLKI